MCGLALLTAVTGYDLERYLTIRSAYGASLGADGRLAFLHDATGTAQVYTLAAPGEWPTQRTFFDDAVSFVAASPTRRELMVGVDDGGNERLQFHRVDLDSGAIENLTGHPDAKHRWGGFSHDGERFAFASNRREEAVFDVYVQGRDERGDAAERVFAGDGWFAVGGWAPDDDRLVLSEATSSFDQDLHVLDLASGERTHLTPHEGDVRHRSAEWAPDGEGLYLVTDRDSDTEYLAHLDAADGTLTPVRETTDWNIDGVAVDHDRAQLVYSRNVDGDTELTLARIDGPTTLVDVPLPPIPGAIAGGVSFGPDGDRIAISASGRSLNTNVYVLDADELRAAVAAGEDREDPSPATVTRWTDAGTAGIPRDSFVDPELVRYPTFDDRSIPAFFSRPPERAPGGDDGLPVIVDIHGGPESQRRPSFSGLIQYFLSRGYAVFEPNVRGSTGYGRAYTELDDVDKRMDAVRDLRAAHKWLAAQPAVDPDRVVLKGGSYGGFMVLAGLTEYPDLWAAGVDVVGIANFVTFLENTGDWRRSLREAEYGSLAEDRTFLESISPITDAEAIDAPLFVIHGENDPRVPVGEAEQIAEAVEAQGQPVELLVFPDEGHGLAKLSNRIEAYRRVVDFLDEHV
jgi:dipeptidyl aminopeptidase/acylaminoacyl peptidase